MYCLFPLFLWLKHQLPNQIDTCLNVFLVVDLKENQILILNNFDFFTQIFISGPIIR